MCTTVLWEEEIGWGHCPYSLARTRTSQQSQTVMGNTQTESGGACSFSGWLWVSGKELAEKMLPGLQGDRWWEYMRYHTRHRGGLWAHTEDDCDFCRTDYVENERRESKHLLCCAALWPPWLTPDICSLTVAGRDQLFKPPGLFSCTHLCWVLWSQQTQREDDQPGKDPCWQPTAFVSK
jgi:hypothetical protein